MTRTLSPLVGKVNDINPSDLGIGTAALPDVSDWPICRTLPNSDTDRAFDTTIGLLAVYLRVRANESRVVIATCVSIHPIDDNWYEEFVKNGLGV